MHCCSQKCQSDQQRLEILMYLSLTYRFVSFISFIYLNVHTYVQKKQKKNIAALFSLSLKLRFLPWFPFGRVAVFTVGTSIRKFNTEAGLKTKSRTGRDPSPPFRCLSLCTAELCTLEVLGLPSDVADKTDESPANAVLKERKCWRRVTDDLTFHLFLHICTKSLFSRNKIFKNAQLHNT